MNETTSSDPNDHEGWEPIDALQVVEDQEDQDVQDILEAVDDLLQLEDDASAASGTASVSPSTASDGNERRADSAPSTTSTVKPRSSKLQLRKRLRKASRKLQHSLNLKQKLVHPVARASVNVTRKIVTGSKATRIRDFVVLPQVVRVLDKYTFTIGILGMLVTEFVLLEYPQLFKYYNLATMLPLLTLRVVLFRRTKQQYFLLDYCYWVNGLGFFLTLLPHLSAQLPSATDSNSVTTTLHQLLHAMQQDNCQEIMWQIFFVGANGPLFFAMIAWNNSLVFHSIDKVTSTYVHLFPALLSWCERWQPSSSSAMNGDLTWSRHLGYPLLFYATWQAVYLIQTEWWHKPVLDADPDLSTSLRYLTRADKMTINKATLKLCRNVGLMSPTETFHPPTLKVKAIFVVLQMVMTLGTFVPVRLMYNHKNAVHTPVILGILAFSVYNGARYYIQVFSKSYEKRYNDGGKEEEYVDTSAVMSEHPLHVKKES